MEKGREERIGGGKKWERRREEGGKGRERGKAMVMKRRGGKETSQ